ncbi:2-dehydro-3-deoxygalactonokinase [Aliiglaciecola sp.]|nr:2-dehydro-3-deoxygalactonokinase [Aliiglaciecola sp.]
MLTQNKMMILGDWGTTVNRLYLCKWHEDHLDICDRAQGQGTKNNPDPETSFFELAQPWFEQHGKIPVYLIGTVGSNLGWKQAEYVACPTDHSRSLSAALRFTARHINFVIFPGLSCINRHNLPDSMRGEETQIFGFLSEQRKQGKSISGSQLICVPGTHTKWVQIDKGQVSTFLTSPIGELYEVLCLHSVLLKTATVEDWDDHGFMQGLELASKSTSSLLHTLFATRTQQVIDGYSNPEAAGFLSGLLIGSDIKSAKRSFEAFSHVVLIGSSFVNSLYQKALTFNQITTDTYDSEWATTRGITTIAAQEWQQGD